MLDSYGRLKSPTNVHDFIDGLKNVQKQSLIKVMFRYYCRSYNYLILLYIKLKKEII